MTRFLACLALVPVLGMGCCQDVLVREPIRSVVGSSARARVRVDCSGTVVLEFVAPRDGATDTWISQERNSVVSWRVQRNGVVDSAGGPGKSRDFGPYAARYKDDDHIYLWLCELPVFADDEMEVEVVVQRAIPGRENLECEVRLFRLNSK